MNIHGIGPLDGAWRGRNEVVAATRKNFAEAAVFSSPKLKA